MSDTETNRKKSSRESQFTALLGLLFIVLKLTGYIDWSWWLVTLPFWITAAIYVFVWLLIFFGLVAGGLFVMAVAVICELYDNRK